MALKRAKPVLKQPNQHLKKIKISKRSKLALKVPNRHLTEALGELCLENKDVDLLLSVNCLVLVWQFGDRKSLSIAKNHPKPSQEFSEQFGPLTYKMKGFSGGNHHQKFTRTSPRTWEDKFLGIPFPASKIENKKLQDSNIGMKVSVQNVFLHPYPSLAVEKTWPRINLRSRMRVPESFKPRMKISIESFLIVC